MQQLGGINAIIYYSGTLFQKSIGFDAHMSSLMSGFLQTWFFVASFIPWLLIDRIGRRPLVSFARILYAKFVLMINQLISMISVMAAVMAVQAALIYQVQNVTAIATSAGIGAAAMLFVFQGAFTIGFQATVWVYPSEILPLRLRQRGSSISTAANWIFNYVSSSCLAQSSWQKSKADDPIDDCSDHTTSHSEHWMEDIHHLCSTECDMGSNHLFLLPRDKGFRIGGCRCTLLRRCSHGAIAIWQGRGRHRFRGRTCL